MTGSGHIHPGPGSTGLGWSVFDGANRDSTSPAAALVGAIQGRLSHPLDPSAQRELQSLAAEGDPVLWARGLLGLADRLQRQGKSEAARVLFQTLAVAGPVPEELRATVELARRRFDAANGGGRLGDQAEHFVGAFWKEASDPYALLGFAVGGTVFKLSHAALTSRLLAGAPGAFTRGLGAKLLAQTGAFGAELPAFVLGSKLARHWGEGAQDWSAPTLGREFLATGLTLAFLKTAGGLSRALGNQPALSQLSLYGGILLAQKVEGRLGLRPAATGAAGHLQALATLLQFNVAGRMSDGLLGETYRKAMAGLEWRRQSLDRRWFAERSRELLPPFLMSAGAGDGEGPGRKGGPKVVELFPMAHEGQARPAKSKPIDPDQALSRARSLTSEVQDCYAKILEALATFRAAAEIQANFLEKDRGEPGMIQELRMIMSDRRRIFRDQAAKGRKLAAELTELHFITSSKPALHERSVNLRQKLKAFGDPSSDLAMGFEIVERGFAKGNYGESLKLLDSWSQLFPEKTWVTAAYPIDFQTHPTRGLQAARLAGMLYGAVAKEVLRGHFQSPSDLSLEHQSPRTKDLDEAPRLLDTLANAGERDYVEVLLNHLSPQTLTQRPVPRETLKFLGSHEEPFRSWFSLHLPALLLRHRGRGAEVLEKIRAIEFFMGPEDRQATHRILDWLTMALERPGHPRHWVAEIPPQDWVRMALAQFGGSGPLAIFARSVDAFVRHPAEPGPALRIAMEAPEAIREDVVGLTGALVGAYLGRAAFGASWLMPSVHQAFPERMTNRRIEDSWILDVGHLAFEQRAQAALDEAAVLRVPIRRVGSVKEASENPVWSAFRRGFDERENRLESMLAETMRTAAEFVAAPPAAVEGRHYLQFHEFLRQERKRIDPLVKELRAYAGEARNRLEEFGLGDKLSAWKEVEGRLQRYGEALTAYDGLLSAASLNVERIGHFKTPAEARTVFLEQITDFGKAFGEIQRPQAAMPGDWVRRLAGTEATDAKRGKVLGLWRQWSREKKVEASASEQQSLEYVLANIPGYLVSDLAYWSEHEPQLAKAWLSRLGFLPRNSALWRDSEIQDLLGGRRMVNFDRLEAEEGILYFYAVHGARVFPTTYRALGPTERRLWRARIEKLPPILLQSLLQPGLRPESFLLMVAELGLSKLGLPIDPG